MSQQQDRLLWHCGYATRPAVSREVCTDSHDHDTDVDLASYLDAISVPQNEPEEASFSSTSFSTIMFRKFSALHSETLTGSRKPIARITARGCRRLGRSASGAGLGRLVRSGSVYVRLSLPISVVGSSHDCMALGGRVLLLGYGSRDLT